MSNTTADMLGASGPVRTVELKGKTYPVHLLTHERQQRFCSWVADRRRERIVAACKDDQEEMAKQLAQHREDWIAGVYEFGEPVILGRAVRVEEVRTIDGKEVKGVKTTVQGGAINTAQGRVALVSILCDCAIDEATALLSAKPAEMNHLLELSFAESFPGEHDDWKPLEPADPNARAAQASAP